MSTRDVRKEMVDHLSVKCCESVSGLRIISKEVGKVMFLTRLVSLNSAFIAVRGVRVGKCSFLGVLKPLLKGRHNCAC